MFASILSVAHNLGYPALVLLIMFESSGVPLPGETALITAAVLASQHRLQIALVIASAAAAAILGDNVGYLIGRKGGRWLLRRPGPFARHRARVLEVGEPFFARHGSKAVFLGRWILGLRTWASWLAGASHMPWRSFSLWNAAGGISWATTLRQAPSSCSESRDSQARSARPACCGPVSDAVGDTKRSPRPSVRRPIASMRVSTASEGSPARAGRARNLTRQTPAIARRRACP
jgi:membrane protein DedA with SNARE-associated domain